MRSARLAFVVTVLAGSLLVASPAIAQEAHPTFVAEMTGFEEAPEAAATLAKGFAGIQVSVDDATVYYTIVVTDASTPITAAHLHLGPRGQAGPVVVGLCAAPANPCQT